jgi:hypothetical protein
MSAQQYRDRAEALVKSADGVRDYNLVLELEAAAAEWRKLAVMADAQDALLAALARIRD